MIVQFPKIDNLRNAKKSAEYHGTTLDYSELAAYPKLDGSNCSVALDDNGSLVAQSRNRILHGGADNFGFAAWVEGRRKELVELLETLEVRAIFGEWMGKGIQKSPLPERYWAAWSVYDPDGGFIPADVIPDDLALPDNMLVVQYLPEPSYCEDEDAVVAATEAEIAECSFHREHFGISIPGEGLVWWHWHGRGPVFKSKHDTILAAGPIGRMVDAVLTTEYIAKARENSFANLQEAGSLKTEFVQWLLKDVLVERRFELAEAGVDLGEFRKVLAREAAARY